MDTIESDVANMEDMSISYLTKAFDMFSGVGSADKKKMLIGVEEIEAMNANVESISN